MNACIYLESLCVSAPAADLLVHSRLTLQLMRLLRNKHAALRERAASALGLLIRHATFIDAKEAPQGEKKLVAPVACTAQFALGRDIIWAPDCGRVKVLTGNQGLLM